ncbi:hypothetical protein BROUX41_001519 [Berkeleyomyces rouxiae]|uniref:uncharacterized protein n=1 Tax=Berkeleyomyces rouxiae TaxID=2035830 RepID=UPI003B81F65F
MLTSTAPAGLDAGLIALIIASTFGVFLCACRQIRRPYPATREAASHGGRDPHIRNTDSPGSDPVPPYEPPLLPLSTFFTPAPSYQPHSPGNLHFPSTASNRSYSVVGAGGTQSPASGSPSRLSLSSSWGVPGTRLPSPLYPDGAQRPDPPYIQQPTLGSDPYGRCHPDSQITSSTGLALSPAGPFSDASRIPRPTQAYPRINPHFEAIIQPPITRTSSLPASAQRRASEKTEQTEAGIANSVSKLRYTTDIVAQTLTGRSVSATQPDSFCNPDFS